MIEAAILTEPSLACSEGYNRFAKHQSRKDFGLRNPTNMRPPHTWAYTR